MQLNDSLFVRGALDSLVSGYAPAAATAQTMPRDRLTGNTSALVSGTGYIRAIQIPVNTAVNNLTVINETAETLGTHCWAGLLDYTLKLVAVSADNTGATFLSGLTQITFALTGAYTTLYPGLHYCVLCASFTGTAPTLAGPNLTPAVSTIAPVFVGTSGSFSTPPALNTQFAAIAGNGSFNYYAYTS
jgi:hypothetical protein